ncbi:MAG: Glutathione S-transferase family protein [Labilithrix sp.]|nr:Glutathione S-transferase family protein [Labilithrix sp.]
MPRLFAESFAPWCEKARWALDHHRVKYAYTEHAPMLGEIVLRIAANRPSGMVTVPLLVDGDESLMGSVDIARYAERVGAGDPLFSPEQDDAIQVWDARSERVMIAGRAMLLARMRVSTDALSEQLPPFIPRALRSALRPLAASGLAHLIRKYEIIDDAQAQHEAESRHALEALRSALADGRDYILGDRFSFADITMTTCLQFIRPADDQYIALGPATREVWTHPQLASEYADLLEWRDRIYPAHRKALVSSKKHIVPPV